MPDPVIIIAAPNGARKTHKDHPALPVSISETVIEASSCYAAGATVLHAHVRGKQEEHVLDAGLYIELLNELKQQVPEMLVQITTEAVSVYTPQQQVDCVKTVVPELACVALREMTGDYQQTDFARDFYFWCAEAGVHIQHILYSVDDLQRFCQYKTDGVIPASQNCVLFVLGRYSADFQSSPDDLKPFLQQNLGDLDWFTCAFGLQEQACVLAGINKSGHARIGFENNLYLPTGVLATSSAALVTELKKAIEGSNRVVATVPQTRDLLRI